MMRTCSLVLLAVTLVIGAPSDGDGSSQTEVPPTPPEVSTASPPDGCHQCNPDACPRSQDECKAAAGLADDPCGCCADGVCGLPENAKCFAPGLGLPSDARAFGACGENLNCVLRQDLLETDQPEALCVCRDEGQVCGSDNTTYSSLCRMKSNNPPVKDGPPVKVWLKHRGPCRAAPWMVTLPTQLEYVRGSGASLDCEVKGYPAPVVSWEKVGSDGIAQILPRDDAEVVVLVRGGPEPGMATSWLQFMALRDVDAATYVCVATNSEGEARAAAKVTVT